MTVLIRPSAYARLRGVTRQAVSKALADGRITGVLRNGRLLIDPARADIEWADNTDVYQQERSSLEQFLSTGRRAALARRKKDKA